MIIHGKSILHTYANYNGTEKPHGTFLGRWDTESVKPTQFFSVVHHDLLSLELGWFDVTEGWK